MYCDETPIPNALRHRQLEARMLRHGSLEYVVIRQRGYPRPMATFRLVSPEAAARAGRYPLEEHFDLAALHPLRSGLVEMCEPCVDRSVRPRDLARALGECLASYLIELGYGHVVTTACIGVADGGAAAAGVYERVLDRCAPEDLRVAARRPLPIERLCPAPGVEEPTPMQAYLMLGAWVCGAPGTRPGRECAELPLLLPLARLRAREARRFLARAA